MESISESNHSDLTKKMLQHPVDGVVCNSVSNDSQIVGANQTWSTCNSKKVSPSLHDKVKARHIEVESIADKRGNRFGENKRIVGTKGVLYNVHPSGYKETEKYKKNVCTNEFEVGNDPLMKLQRLQILLRKFQNLRFQVDTLKRHGITTLFRGPSSRNKGIRIAVVKAKEELNENNQYLHELTEYYLQRKGRLPDPTLEPLLNKDGKLYAATKLELLELIDKAESDLRDVDNWRHSVGYYGNLQCIELTKVHTLLERRVQETVDQICDLKLGDSSEYCCCSLFKKYSVPFSTARKTPLPKEVIEVLLSSRYSAFQDNLQERVKYMSSTFRRRQKFDLDQLIHQYPMGICLEVLRKEYKKRYEEISMFADPDFENRPHYNDIFHENVQLLLIPNNKVGNIELPLIVFPKCQNQKSSFVVSTFQNKYHNLKVILNKRNVSYISINDSEVVEKLGGVVKDWGFGTVEAFIQLCLEVVKTVDGDEGFQLYSIKKIIQKHRRCFKSSEKIVYLCINSAMVIQDIIDAHCYSDITNSPSNDMEPGDQSPPVLMSLPPLPAPKFYSPADVFPPCVETSKFSSSIIKPGETWDCQVVSVLGHHQISVRIFDGKLPQASPFPCSLREGRLMKDPQESKLIIESMVQPQIKLQAKFYTCKDDESNTWEISLRYRESNRGLYQSVRNTVQRILSKRKKISLDEDELSDVDL